MDNEEQEGNPDDGIFDEGEGQQQQEQSGAGEGEGQGQGEGEGEGEGQQQAGKISLSPEDLAAIGQEFGKGFATVQTQQEQAKPKTYTPEEMDQMMAVWKPSEDLYDRLGDPATRMAAFIEMRDGIMKQSLTAQQMLVEQVKAELMGEIAPVREFATTQRVEKLRTQFLDQHSGLKKYEKLMPMVSAALERSGYKPTSVEDGFKKLADEAVKVIRENIDPNFTLDSKQNQNNGQQTGMPKMSTTSVRGGQGKAGSASSGKSGSPDDGLWD